MNNTQVRIPFVDLELQNQLIQTQIQQAIQAVIQKGDFILGQAVADFEEEFAAASGAQYGIGVASGTDAIALGLQACGVGVGDEVILPANTFVATLIGVLRAGATPVLVDCDLKTALIDLNAAEKAITPKTKAIIPVHLYGQMVSPRQLLDFASKYNVLIFEDAAQAHLAQREGYHAGSVGIAAAFSFYPSKNLGAFGDGGMLVTRDLMVAQRMLRLRNYGASRKYFHTDIGTNSRLDTIQAAVLLAKLPYLAEWNRDRLRIAQKYDSLIKALPKKTIVSLQNQSSRHVYHLYVVRVLESCLLDRQALQEGLAQTGIQTGIHYPISCHLQPAFANLGYKAGDFPNAELLAEQILSLPMYPGLSDTQVNSVVSTMQNLLANCSTVTIPA